MKGGPAEVTQTRSNKQSLGDNSFIVVLLCCGKEEKNKRVWRRRKERRNGEIRFGGGREYLTQQLCKSHSGISMCCAGFDMIYILKLSFHLEPQQFLHLLK